MCGRGRRTDGRGNTTTLDYNTLGYLTKKTDPRVQVTRANGFQEEIRPETAFTYDRTGHLVGVRDANGNLNTQRWNYGGEQPTLAAEYHADGGVKTFGYDVFGNRRVQMDELGRRTDSHFDAENRLVRVERPVLTVGAHIGQRAWEAYEYDEQGQRIAQSNVLGRSTTDYDSEGNVIRTVSAAGREARFSQVWVQPSDGSAGY